MKELNKVNDMREHAQLILRALADKDFVEKLKNTSIDTGHPAVGIVTANDLTIQEIKNLMRDFLEETNC